MLLVMLIVATISIAENSRTHEGLIPRTTRQRLSIGQDALDLISQTRILRKTFFFENHSFITRVLQSPYLLSPCRKFSFDFILEFTLHITHLNVKYTYGPTATVLHYTKYFVKQISLHFNILLYIRQFISIFHVLRVRCNSSLALIGIPA